VKKRNIVWLCISIVMILAVVPVSACTPTPAPAGTIPVVISTYPANNAQNVASNTLVTATFNEAMNASTINTVTFTLTQASKPVSGKVTYSGTKATFTPDVNLELCATYTARITTGAKDPAGNALASDYVWNFSTSCATGTGPRVVSGTARTSGYGGGGVWGGGGGNPGVATTMATVTATSPANGQKCVDINSQITATFSEVMDSSTINTTTFTVMQGNTVVAGTVTYIGVTAFFKPAAQLAPNSIFTATLSQGIKDQSGSPLANPYSWTFTTCSVTLPVVISTIPTGLPTDNCTPPNSAISAIFNEPLKPSTIISPATTFTLVQTAGSIHVNGTVTLSLDGLTAIFTPSVNLLGLTQYTATISTGVTDLAGKHMAAPHIWTFTTCATPDTTHPTLIATIPADLAENVSVNTLVTATFDKAMNPLTLNNTTFTLQDLNTSIFVTATSIITIGAVTVFTPNANLVNGHRYQANITTGAQDLAGNSLAPGIVPNPWTFTIVVPAPIGPLLPDLLTAGDYRILSEAGISNTVTALTMVTGDIGVSPAAATTITGFVLTLPPASPFATSPYVTGKVFAPGYASPTPANLTVATTAMTNAYTNAANTITPAPVVNTGSGHLGGLSLAPGVYKFTTNVDINSTLHLAAVGANDTWIFQIPGNLVLATNQQVIVDPPGQAKNIYWQVTGSTTLFPGSNFSGVILDATLIALQTGATLHGRALSQTAVTLDANQVGP